MIATTSITVRRMLGLAALATVLSSTAPVLADEVILAGTIRDFTKAHVDFDVVPPDGTGHFAHNVRLALSADQRPVLDADGYRVISEWRDNLSHAIAPHLYEPDDGDGDDCITIDDSLGSQGLAGSGGIQSASSFQEWFRDVPGVNQSVVHSIKLVRDGAGVFGYLDDDFHPVDGRLFGNEGDSNNNFFTYHIRARFQFKECWAQFVEFDGGDGAWMFIDGQLVMDLGGVQADEWQFVELDRLGLTDGQIYMLDLFYAHRNSASSTFRLRTTLELSSISLPPTVSAMFD